MSRWGEKTLTARGSLPPKGIKGIKTRFFSGEYEHNKDWKIVLDQGKVKLYHFLITPIYVDDVSFTSVRNDYNCLATCGGNREIGADGNEFKMDWIDVPVDLDHLDLTTLEFLSIVVTYRVEAVAPPPAEWISLSADYEKLFISQHSSDVAFEISGEVIPAHKLILSARVPVFEAMFSSGMKEAKTGRIRIDDTDAASFKHLLRFIYCGKLPEDFKETVDSLLPIADKYGLQDLKDACEVVLKDLLVRDNVIRTLISARLYCCSNLKKECCKILKDEDQIISRKQIRLFMSHLDLLADEELQIAPTLLRMATSYEHSEDFKQELKQGLKGACAVALKGQLSRENVISTLILAHLHDCHDLKKECLQHLGRYKTSLGAEDIKPLQSHPDLMAEAFLNCLKK